MLLKDLEKQIKEIKKKHMFKNCDINVRIFACEDPYNEVIIFETFFMGRLVRFKHNAISTMQDYTEVGR